MNQDSFTPLGYIRLSFLMDLCVETSFVNRVKIFIVGCLVCQDLLFVWSKYFCMALIDVQIKCSRYAERGVPLLNHFDLGSLVGNKVL